jgi:hypothetical protein
MAKSGGVLPPGTVRETVQQERFISEADTHKNQFSGMDFWDVMEHSGDAATWRRENYSCYINRGVNRGSTLVKFFEWNSLEHLRDKEEIVFDGKVVQRGIGGGDFHFIFKKGSERIAEGNFEIDAPEKKSWGPGANAGGGTQSEIVDIIRELRERNGGGKESLNEAAFLSALRIQEAAIIKNQLGPQDILAMARELRGGAPSSDMPEWAKQLVGALIPMGIGLLGKILEPKDPIAAITQVTQAMSAIRTANGEGGASATPDLLTTAVNNGGQLLNGIAQVIQQLNQMGEARARQLALAGASKTAAAAATATGAAPTAESAAIPPVSDPHRNVPKSHVVASAQAQLRQAPTPGSAEFQTFLAQCIVNMVANGDDGEFVYNWLEVADPNILVQLRQYVQQNQLNAEQMGQAIASGALHPKLSELKNLPNYKQFVQEFYVVLMAPAENAA